MIMVVVLYLITWDCNHGVKLWESDPLVSTDISIEDCRIWGVAEGKKKTAEWQVKGYENVSTNVDCQWEPAENYGL